VKVLLLIIYFISFDSFSKNALRKKRSLYSSYKKTVDTFQNQVCKPGTEEKFWELYYKFKGKGFYIPIKENIRVNKKAIKSNFRLITQKINWIKKTSKKLSKYKKLPEIEQDLIQLQKLVNSNLRYKFLLEVKGEPEGVILFNVNKNIVKLKSTYHLITKKIFYLLNFNYPNNHLGNRVRYENYKTARNISSALKADAMFVRRKILEDGAMDPMSKSNDRYLRTALDNIKLRLDQTTDFIEDDLRVDLEWAMEKLKKNVNKGLNYQLNKLAEWEKREKLRFEFYNKVFHSSDKSLAKLVSEKNNASESLQSFIYKKQADTYKYWMKEDERLRKIFIMENILYNEVGNLDPLKVERKEILRIIYKRTTTPPYNLLLPHQKISKYLNNIQTDKYKWLNTFLRRGEFSYTLYYIPSVIRVFCSNVSRNGWKLRNENIKLSINFLKELGKESTLTESIRYFSRVSMVGKIDMSLIWKNFEAVGEVPGQKLSNTSHLEKKFLKGQFRYFYKVNHEGNLFGVFEVLNKTYMVNIDDLKKPKFFNYRNPHLFKYFKEKSKLSSVR
jgi:hypothetical protein